MRPIFLLRFCSPLLVLAGVILPRCFGATELTASSPFMPPASAQTDNNATPAGSPLELHGIVTMDGGYKFDLFDPNSHKDDWVGFNEPNKPYVVQSHDVAHNRVTVQYQGRELTLTLPQSKVAPMNGAQMAQAVPMVQPTMPMGRPAAGASNPEDERQRMQRIVEEIKRRRALRAAQQRQNGAPVPSSTPPQPRNY